ncbi:MAG TPA: class I SAM-dependent methyltransferase [bacterium]|nr:class I SAM-dependent methyltransferase [bacterium]
MADIREYERTRYRGLDQKIVHAAESRIVRDFINLIYQEDEKILDIPCGYGRFTSFLVEEPIRVFVGDVNRKMLLRVQERFRDRMNFTQGNIMELPFRDKAFHAILSIRLFQHFHTPGERIAAFSEIARVISGWAVISVYTSSVLHKCMRMFREHHKITMATTGQIQDEIEQSGLRLLESKKILPGVHAQTILLVEPQ